MGSTHIYILLCYLLGDYHIYQGTYNKGSILIPANASVLIPLFIMATNFHTHYQPQNFDWRVFLLLNEVKDSDTETDTDGHEATNRIADTQDLDSVQHPYPPEELNRMRRAGIIASIFSVIVGLVTWVVWPLPLYRDYIFTKSVSSSISLTLHSCCCSSSLIV